MMTNHRSLLTLAAAAVLAALPSLQAEDATPPGPPPPPPPPPPGAPGPDGPGPRGPGGGPGGRMDPAARIKELKEKLNLTSEQVEKIKGVFEKTRPQLEALRADQSLSPEDRRAKAMEIRKAQREEIRALLTPEQQAKFQEAWKERVGPGGPGGPGGPPGAKGGPRKPKGEK